MKSAFNPLQVAIYGALNGVISCPVYDAVPEGAAWPYMVIGETTGVDWSTKLENGQVVTITLHGWSRAKGTKEVNDLMDEALQALTGPALSVTDFTLVLLRFDFASVIRDPDGITRHGMLRLRGLLEEV